jgi:DNA-binding transcriptional LysR family regulator
MAVASLEYLAGHGEPRTRRDLRRHRCLLGYTGDALTQTKGGLQHVQDAFYTNDINLLTDAARRGLGGSPCCHPCTRAR